MSYLILAATALLVLGTLLGILGLGRLRRRRLFAGSGNALLGASMLLGGAALGGIALNLHTYARLTHERALADLRFRALEAQRFEVTIEYAGRDEQDRFELYGDEWQMDARILKWHGLANVLGFDALYRVERLSGRYRDVAQERGGPRSVHALASHSGLDVWALAQRYELPWVDALYGSAAYLPMRDGAHFSVHVTQSGLIARAMNEAGIEAVREWR